MCWRRNRQTHDYGWRFQHTSLNNWQNKVDSNNREQGSAKRLALFLNKVSIEYIYTSICILLTSAFILQWWSGVVATEIIWPARPKTLLSVFLQKKFATPDLEDLNNITHLS